jgi:RNA recognition motif-containing protein
MIDIKVFFIIDKDKEKSTVYLKNVPESVDRKVLQDIFEKVGPIHSIDYVPTKKIAFVTFKSIESAVSVIGQPFPINGDILVPEERRRSSFVSKDKGVRVGNGNFFQKPKNGSFKRGSKEKTA